MTSSRLSEQATCLEMKSAKSKAAEDKTFNRKQLSKLVSQSARDLLLKWTIGSDFDSLLTWIQKWSKGFDMNSKVMGQVLI